jgi:hypothetical protein
MATKAAVGGQGPSQDLLKQHVSGGDEARLSSTNFLAKAMVDTACSAVIKRTRVRSKRNAGDLPVILFAADAPLAAISDRGLSGCNLLAGTGFASWCGMYI